MGGVWGDFIKWATASYMTKRPSTAMDGVWLWQLTSANDPRNHEMTNRPC